MTQEIVPHEPGVVLNPHPCQLECAGRMDLAYGHLKSVWSVTSTHAVIL